MDRVDQLCHFTLRTQLKDAKKTYNWLIDLEVGLRPRIATLTIHPSFPSRHQNDCSQQIVSLASSRGGFDTEAIICGTGVSIYPDLSAQSDALIATYFWSAQIDLSPSVANL